MSKKWKNAFMNSKGNLRDMHFKKRGLAWWIYLRTCVSVSSIKKLTQF